MNLSLTFFVALTIYSFIGVLGIIIGVIRGGELGKVISYFMMFSLVAAVGFSYILGVSEAIIKAVGL